MTPNVLCIIQARYHSTRLEGKMLLKLGDETLIQRAWRLAGEAFGAENCVIAIPLDQPREFTDHLDAIGARVFVGEHEEWDVLSRFYECAHEYRWHPDTVLHRWTPDDPFKSPAACRRVVDGERLPVEIGGEAFTLAELDAAQGRFEPLWGHVLPNESREHITFALFDYPPPPAPKGEIWTVDTAEDLERARARCSRDRTGAGHGIGEYLWGVSGQNVGPSPLAALRAIQESA